MFCWQDKYIIFEERLRNQELSECISKRATETGNYSWIHFQHVCVKEITNRCTTVTEIVTVGNPSCLKQALRIQRKLFFLEAKWKKAKNIIVSPQWCQSKMSTNFFTIPRSVHSRKASGTCFCILFQELRINCQFRLCFLLLHKSRVLRFCKCYPAIVLFWFFRECGQRAVLQHLRSIFIRTLIATLAILSFVKMSSKQGILFSERESKLQLIFNQGNRKKFTILKTEVWWEQFLFMQIKVGLATRKLEIGRSRKWRTFPETNLKPLWPRQKGDRCRGGRKLLWVSSFPLLMNQLAVRGDGEGHMPKMQLLSGSEGCGKEFNQELLLSMMGNRL